MLMLLVIISVTTGVLAVAVRQQTPQRTARVYYVAPDGSDRGPGDLERPFATLAQALPRLRAGDTLYVRNGSYHEALRDLQLHAGTSAQPVRVLAYPSERPVLAGLLWLHGADYWLVDGINVTWDARLASPDDHMLKFTGGHDWTFTNAEVWGARSFAAILVTGQARGWTLSHLFVHDTLAANALNQDQLIYVSDARQGVIEFNLLVNSPNGRGVKLGRPAAGDHEPSDVRVRYNTIVGNPGGNVSTSYDAHDNVIERNILVDGGLDANVESFNLDRDTHTIVRDNIGWGSPALIEAGALLDGGGNSILNPRLDANFRPTNSALLDADGTPLYGHLARPD
jgi:hypothetical protein